MSATEPEPEPIGYGTTQDDPFMLHKVVQVPFFGHQTGCAEAQRIRAFWSRLADTGERLQRCTACFPDQRTALD
jgi:hypothetical protein